MTIDRAALRKLAEAATPGPWKYENDGTIGGILVRPPTGRPHRHDSPADAAFSAAARTAVPDLLDQLDAAEAELEEVTSSPSPRGQEAEELRAGIEALLKDEPGGDIESNREWRAALLMLLDSVDARDSLSHLVAKDEIEKLRTRRDELLATIARISQSTPLDSEVAEALEQRGKLLAEIGTLRAQLAASERKLELLDDERHRMVLGADEYRVELAAARPIVEAAKAWRRHAQNHGAAVIVCRPCQTKDVGFCDEHNMSYEVLLVLEGELEAAIDAATATGQG